MQARTSTSTPTQHHSFGGRPKTWPLRLCCCATARSWQPSRSGECASSRRCCSRLRRHSKWKVPPRVSVRSVGGLGCRQPTARIHLPLSSRDTRTELLLRHQRSRADSDPTATSGTPSKLAGELRASTTMTTTARATTTIVGADGATTATTTASAAGYRTSEVRGLLAKASVTRSSPHSFGLQPTYRDATGTPTPVCGSRTTGSRATPVGRLTISL
jgi:hypothetical protein